MAKLAYCGIGMTCNTIPIGLVEESQHGGTADNRSCCNHALGIDAIS